MQVLPNRFTSYNLTDEEELRGSVLSIEQKWYMQNKLAQTAELQSALEFTPDDTLGYAQQEAYLRGQLDLCEFFLQNSDSAEEMLIRITTGTTDTIEE